MFRFRQVYFSVALMLYPSDARRIRMRGEALHDDVLGAGVAQKVQKVQKVQKANRTRYGNQLNLSLAKRLMRMSAIRKAKLGDDEHIRWWKKIPSDLQTMFIDALGGGDAGKNVAHGIIKGQLHEMKKDGGAWRSSLLEKELFLRYLNYLRKLLNYVFIVRAARMCYEFPSWIWLYGYRLNYESLSVCLDEFVEFATTNASRRADWSCNVFCELVDGDRRREETKSSLACNPGSPLIADLGPPKGYCRLLDSNATVNTELGPVQGYKRPIVKESDCDSDDCLQELVRSGVAEGRKKMVTTYWGIRFGADVERFKRPRPAQPWEKFNVPDYYNETERPQHCGPGGSDKYGADCLYLSVYVPPRPEGLLPVVFSLRGSGFFGGDSWDDGYYDMQRHAYDQNAVFVTANARMGLMGFWASTALQDEDEDGSTGNYGLLDQRLAMQWMKENIQHFGGDPEQITISGYSSGGISAIFHTYSPGSNGLFNQAIIAGAPPAGSWTYQDLDKATLMYSELGEAFGCEGEGATANMTSLETTVDEIRPEVRNKRKEQIECLRKLPDSVFISFWNSQTSALLAHLKKQIPGMSGLAAFGLDVLGSAIWSSFGFEGWTGERHEGGPEDLAIRAPATWPLLFVGPVIDGSVVGLPKRPGDPTLKPHPVNTFISYARDEGSFFALSLLFSYPWLARPRLNYATTREIFQWAFGNEVADDIRSKDLYKNLGPYKRMSKAIQEAMFTCPTEQYASQLGNSRSDGRRPKVFVARTDFNPIKSEGFLSMLFGEKRIPAVMHQTLGAHHFVEVAYIMGEGFRRMPMYSAARGFSEKMRCYMALFTHHGEPGFNQAVVELEANVRQFRIEQKDGASGFWGSLVGGRNGKMKDTQWIFHPTDDKRSLRLVTSPYYPAEATLEYYPVSRRGNRSMPTPPEERYEVELCGEQASVSQKYLSQKDQVGFYVTYGESAQRIGFQFEDQALARRWVNKLQSVIGKCKSQASTRRSLPEICKRHDKHFDQDKHDKAWYEHSLRAPGVYSLDEVSQHQEFIQRDLDHCKYWNRQLESWNDPYPKNNCRGCRSSHDSGLSESFSSVPVPDIQEDEDDEAVAKAEIIVDPGFRNIRDPSWTSAAGDFTSPPGDDHVFKF